MRIGADEADDNGREVKSLYRRLAKRLHPDQTGSWNESDQQLWEEATAAYQALDLENLRRIDLIVSLKAGEEIPSSRTKELRAHRQDLLDALAGLEAELASLRDHPGWGFAKRRINKAFREKISRDIEAMFQDGKSRLAEVEAEINRILRPRAKRKSAAKKKTAKKRAVPRPARPASFEQDIFPF
jgi:curved DNA-binding protein CbpA